MKLAPITKVIHTIIAIGDAAAIAIASIDPATLPPKWAAVFIGIQHFALIMRKEGPQVGAAVESGYDQLVAASATTPDVPTPPVPS